MGKNSKKNQKDKKVKPVKVLQQTNNIVPPPEPEVHTTTDEGGNTTEQVVVNNPQITITNTTPNILQEIQQTIVDTLTSGKLKDDSIANTLRLINKIIIDALEVNGIKPIPKAQEKPKETPKPTAEVTPEIKETPKEAETGFKVEETPKPVEQPVIPPVVETPTGRVVSEKILIAGVGVELENDRGKYLTQFIWNVVFYSQIEKEDCEQYDLAVKAPFITADHLLHQEIEDINLLAPLFKEFELLKNKVREFVDDYLVKNTQYKYYRVTPIF